MNKIKFLILLLALPLFFTGCDQEQDDLVTANATEGGIVEPQNSLINYIVGDNGTYTAELKVFQGAVKTTSIEVYKQFKGVLGTSEKVLWRTLPVTATATDFLAFSFNYDELREGLTAGGAEIPADDHLLSIGDSWTLSYVSTTSEGNKHQNASNAATSVAVATRLAGEYEVIESTYWRLGVNNGGWNGGTRIIKSVNSTTYLHEGFGPFEFADFGDAAKFYIVVDPDNTTHYPKVFEGFTVTGRGDYLITCEEDANFIANAPCATSNYVVLDNENGKDVLYLTYGYYIDGSGPREFYEVLRKK